VSDSKLAGLEASLRLEALEFRVGEALTNAPEPEAALRRAADVLTAAAQNHASALTELWRSDPTAVLRVLVAVCGIAPFLARFAAARPEVWLEAARAGLPPRTLEAHQESLTRALEAAPDDAAPAVLRRYKYAELIRICARDADPQLVPLERSGETLTEITLLADALLVHAYRVARKRVASRLGVPRWYTGEQVFEPGFTVLGLGKLGGGELNFSSDVDVIHVYESPPQGGLGKGPSGASLEEYAKRLANEFGPIASEVTADGFLYRVDLDLRPEGAQGPIAIGSNALAVYYDGSAAMWEKAAFTKARPVAGNLGFGWHVVRRVHPMIYRSAMDFAAVASIQEMKARIEEAHASRGDDFHVKLGAGGIRDLEFATQALQLLQGGRMPDLRGRSTQEALESLAAHSVLPDEEAQGLLEAYRFLRRLENRLQMEAERQVHTLAAAGPARTRAERAMGYTAPDGPAAFARDLGTHRRRVRDAFERLLSEEGEERMVALFARGAARLLRFPTTRGMVEELARHFARELEQAADPELALNNLDRFIQGIGTRTFYWGLLLDRPELVPRLSSLFGASKYLSNLLASSPDLIEPVFRDPDVLLLSPEELRSDLHHIAEEQAASSDRDPAELDLASLRLFQQRQLVNIGLLDLGEKIDRRQVEAALTDVADACLERAYEVARAHLAQAARAPEPPPDGHFCVVGMGKLGSCEMSYGSDLDVIFLYEPPSTEGHVYYARLSQKLISTLDTSTSEGKCYSVDARLRPSGGQGALVSSLEGLREHHERGAMTWERQALLRARPVAGELALGAQFDTLRREILARPLPEDLAEEIHRIRQRLEKEVAQEGEGRRDLKLGRGGLVDVESAAQFLQLHHGPEHPTLFDPDGTETQLARLQSLGLLEAERASVLLEGWDFLQKLSSRLRIVQNRSISDLREDRADLDSVARSLGYEASTRSGDARRPLLADYQRHTDGIRAVYLEVLGVGDA